MSAVCGFILCCVAVTVSSNRLNRVSEWLQAGV